MHMMHAFAAHAFHRRTRDEVDDCLATTRHRLANCPYSSLRKLRCEYHNGVLYIRGQVPSFYLKQVVDNLVSVAKEFCSVRNEVEVLAQTTRPR
jgi:hypothetical protein